MSFEREEATVRHFWGVFLAMGSLSTFTSDTDFLTPGSTAGKDLSWISQLSTWSLNSVSGSVLRSGWRSSEASLCFWRLFRRTLENLSAWSQAMEDSLQVLLHQAFYLFLAFFPWCSLNLCLPLFPIFRLHLVLHKHPLDQYFWNPSHSCTIFAIFATSACYLFCYLPST